MTLRNDQIAIVHGVSRNLQSLADITFPNHAEYASKHGYVVQTREVEPSENVWGKIRILQQVFADSNIRRALWIDADAIFTNVELSLIQHLPDGKVVMACDIFGPNAGVIWLENCPEVQRLLWTVATMGRQMFATAPWPEQCALRYFAFHPPYNKLVTYVGQHQMNAYLNENYPVKKGRPQDGFGQWQPGDFILHLPGINNTLRIKIFKRFLQTSSLSFGNC